MSKFNTIPIQGKNNEHDLQHGLVSADIHHTPGASDPTLKDVLGAYDWLSGDLDHGGGIEPDVGDSVVGGENNLHRTLGGRTQSLLAALDYATPGKQARRDRVRRVNAKDFDASEYFDDENEVFAAEGVHAVIQSALAGDMWSMRWIFALEQVENDDLPTRDDIFELFEARDYVFQTRFVYEMWRRDLALEMPFMMAPLARHLLSQANGALSETEETLDIRHALVLMNLIWAHPGIRADILSRSYFMYIEARNEKSSDAQYELMLALLESHYLISRGVKKLGYYLTGRNPVRLREETMAEKSLTNFLAEYRGWSSLY